MEGSRTLDNSGSLNYSSPLHLHCPILFFHVIQSISLFSITPDFPTCFIPPISLFILAISIPCCSHDYTINKRRISSPICPFQSLFFPPVTTISSSIITDSSPLISWDEPCIWGYICPPLLASATLRDKDVVERRILNKLFEIYLVKSTKKEMYLWPKDFGRGSNPRACLGKYRSLRRSVSEERGANYCASWWFWISMLI